MLNLAISWLPYGDVPEEDILVSFGLSRRQFLHRLKGLVDRYREQLNPTTATQLLLTTGIAQRSQCQAGAQA